MAQAIQSFGDIALRNIKAMRVPSY